MITIEKTQDLYLTKDELEEFCGEHGWLDRCTKDSRNKVLILCILGATAKELAQAIWICSYIDSQGYTTYDEEMLDIEKMLIAEAKKRRGAE